MFRNKDKGFTLFEMLAVLAILAIIAGIAVPRVMATIEKAKITALEHGVSEIKHLIMRLEITEIKGKDKMITYKQSGEGSDDDEDGEQDYLSNYLEKYLEKAVKIKVGGEYIEDYEHYSNFDGFKNPYSGKSGVVNWKKYDFNDDKFWRHAFFITDNENCEYAKTNYNKDDFVKYLQGSIVIYFNDVKDRIEIYYITKDGSKSETVEYLQY